MDANFTVRVTQMQSEDSAKRHFVFWAMRVSPETGILQVGSGTAEWLFNPIKGEDALEAADKAEELLFVL